MLRGVSMAVSSAGRAVRRHCVAAASPRLPPPPAVARDNVLAAPLDAHPDLHPAVRAALSLSNASQSQLSAARISAAVRQYQRSPSDTGSPEVQGAWNDSESVAVSAPSIPRVRALLSWLPC